MTDTFLPVGYSIPKPITNYLELESGENKIRILSAPIFGFEWWKDKEGNILPKGQQIKKGDVCVRVRMGEKVPVKAAETVKHFWAMPVWNYSAQRVQIWVLNKVSIQRPISLITQNPKWGSPTEYDLNITKTGEGFDTEYSVTNDPKEPLEKTIIEAFAATRIDLNRLFDGADPFETE